MSCLWLWSVFWICSSSCVGWRQCGSLGTWGLNITVSLTDKQGDGLLQHSHDVGFVDSGHARSFVVPGVLEGVLSDASASVLGDQFDALNNTVDDLRQQKDKKRTEVTHSWTEHNLINNQTVEGCKRLQLLPETQKEKVDVAEYTSGKLGWLKNQWKTG